MKKFIAIVLVLIMSLSMFTGCASWQRSVKSTVSDFTGGLYRRVTAYSYDGDVLGVWEGKFDVSESSTETFFDLNGKRVILQNCIIINEELPIQRDAADPNVIRLENNE
jgi:hypothetical protein